MNFKYLRFTTSFSKVKHLQFPFNLPRTRQKANLISHMISLKGDSYIKKQIGGDDFIPNRIFIVDRATLIAFFCLIHSRLFVFCVIELNWTLFYGESLEYFLDVPSGVEAFRFNWRWFCINCDKFQADSKKERINNFL